MLLICATEVDHPTALAHHRDMGGVTTTSAAGANRVTASGGHSPLRSNGPTRTGLRPQAVRVTCTATSMECRPPPTQTPLIGLTSA